MYQTTSRAFPCLSTPAHTLFLGSKQFSRVCYSSWYCLCDHENASFLEFLEFGVTQVRRWRLALTNSDEENTKKASQAATSVRSIAELKVVTPKGSAKHWLTARNTRSSLGWTPGRIGLGRHTMPAFNREFAVSRLFMDAFPVAAAVAEAAKQ